MAEDVFAITTRGLEAVSAREIASLPDVAVTEVTYRRVEASCGGPIKPLLGLRTVDDLYLHLATWSGISRHRSTLATMESLASKLDISRAYEVCAGLRPVQEKPSFSVTASFVGKRNYSAEEIKHALAEGIRSRHGWEYSADDRTSDLNVRLFIEHELAYVGVRLSEHPLHERPYQRVHLPGALKPSVAAALVELSDPALGMLLLDPFCGSGTILIEAGMRGLSVVGGDYDGSAVATSLKNTRLAGIDARVERWDARSLPLGDDSVGRAVSNLPWGRQIVVDESLSELYERAFGEMLRVVRPGGRIVLLTSLPELLSSFDAICVERLEISLFGQTPTVMIFESSA